MIACPFCEGQGLVHKAKLKRKDITIYICDECDTIWQDLNIREDNCQNFDDFMAQLELKGLWEEFEIIERL